jgi:hypothetical protein
MSNPFLMKDEELNNPRAAAKYNLDVMQGFKEAANNGQQRLAIDYSVRVIDILAKRVLELESQVADCIAQCATSTKEAPAKAKAKVAEEVSA